MTPKPMIIGKILWFNTRGICYSVWGNTPVFTRGQFFGLRVLSLPAPVRVCLSVCQSLACPHDNSGPVQARITKFEPKMQNTLVKVPFVLWSHRPWISMKNLTWNSNLPNFKLVRTITHHPFKLRSLNLDQKCKIHWLRSLLFWEAIDVDLQSQILLKKANFQVSPLLEIHNHHITH